MKVLGQNLMLQWLRKNIYRYGLTQFEGKVKVGQSELVFWDLDGDKVDRERFIGKKWLVVVDYHS